MNFLGIPMYSILPEVIDSVTEIFLRHSDCATMLGSELYGLQSIYDLYGTEYEDIIPAYVSSEMGGSWGMYGTVYKFRLTEEFKAHIRKERLTCMFKVGDNYVLENLALYRGDKCLFTCCSHEAFDYIIPELSDEVSDEVLQAVRVVIERTELYAQMKAVSGGLQAAPDKKEQKELTILLDLCCYVDEAKRRCMYAPPQYKCDFAKFKKIAKKYLTHNTYAVLEEVSGYAALQPQPVPQTCEQILDALDTDKTFAPNYICSDYYNQVQSEIYMLKYIRGEYGKPVEKTPSLCIARELTAMEKMIFDREFCYDPPHFYRNKLAMRCELGMGDNNEEYLNNAKRRAAEIYNILFDGGVDMFFFDNYIYDFDFDMGGTVYINNITAMVKRMLKFSLGYQKKYEHKVVRDIPFDKEDNDDVIRKNRVCCYPDNTFDAIGVIAAQIAEQNDPTIHLVSFENNCIFTVYDDRGCDIVFYDKEKFKKFYPLLQKYFLKYDLELMKQRLDKID